MTGAEITGLGDLRGLRSAPPLRPDQRRGLQDELRRRVGACAWCTIGVMAPDRDRARAVLREFEQALGWPPLTVAAEEAGRPEEPEGPVFLKGHQRNGTVRVRGEAGLGEGVLISGHGADDPASEDTWGPLPLDLFAADPPSGVPGATGP
ncbi:MAG: DUF1824 family protein [Cyanobacteriota bacterium]|nr:DUF1824 family protein [Cyanobacteriota bacterium]